MNKNIEMIDEVSILLDELTEKVVFVGGAVTALLITDLALSDIRPTKDVDVIVEVTSYIEYSKLEENLSNKGFKQRINSQDPLCRWIIGNTIVDFMPTDTKILGFSNLWYSDAIQNYTLQKMPGGRTIKIVNPPYLKISPPNLKQYIQHHLSEFKKNHQFRDAIAGYLPTDLNSQNRFSVIINRIENICETKGI